MSSKLIHIARAEETLGKFSEDEVRALLAAEFLWGTDDFWFAGMPEWRPLSRLDEVLAADPTVAQRAKEMMTAAGNLLSASAGIIVEQARALAEKGGEGLNQSKRKLLEGYIPQIIKLLREKLGAPVINAARAAIESDAVMTKTFGLLYDFLPRPVGRLVSEKEFIAFCLEHRKRLLG